MVPTIGFEPTTYWLQVSCSTNWAKSAKTKIVKKLFLFVDIIGIYKSKINNKMVEREGLEPPTLCL